MVFSLGHCTYRFNKWSYENNTPGQRYRYLPVQLHKGAKDSIEEKGLDDFLLAHKNIRAYFHEHQNKNEFYNYKGLANNLSLSVFRVDSPIKGDISSKDETRLLFQLIRMDTKTKIMTMRECHWNASSIIILSGENLKRLNYSCNH